jgi:DNA-binding FadR family transcriptional regulator
MKNLPEPKLRIPGTIARDLGIRIVSGTLRPGSILEREADASEQRKVSRSAYREAMRILVAKGLVESKPKVGTRVNERSAWTYISALALRHSKVRGAIFGPAILAIIRLDTSLLHGEPIVFPR